MQAKYLLSLAVILSSFVAQANGNFPGNDYDARKSDVVGGVFSQETKKPLSNVSITAYSANKKEKVVYTDNLGNFSFDELRPGTYKLVFEKEGFKKVTKETTVLRVDEGAQVNVSMQEHKAFDFIQAPSSTFFDF